MLIYVCCLSVVLCHRRCVISILRAKLLLFFHICKGLGENRTLITLFYAMRVLLHCLIQRHRSFVPAFGTFLFQLFIHRRGIHAAKSFNCTDMFVLCQHVCYPTYFERQKQIQILLCDLAHGRISFAFTNVKALSACSVWNRYWSTKS